MKFSLLDTACSGRKRYRFFQKHAHLSFIMKVSALYIILMTTSLQLFSNTGKGQDLESIKVTIELNHEDLTSFFKKIESQTRLKFFYFPEQVKEYKDLTLEKGTRSVKAALDEVMGGMGLGYSQRENTVVVRVRDKIEGKVLIVVKGRVTDSKTNEPLAGVNVVIKGSINGTTTDAQGSYVITAEGNDILVFSFIGFKSQEIPVEARNYIDLSLQEDIASLGEIVVNAGYWQITDRDKTGSISKVSSETISGQPISNPLASLEGRVPGVFIQQNTGVPGGGFRIQIRNRNSLRTNGNDPLYIIDGVPYTSTSFASDLSGVTQGGNPLSGINPSDIASIEILKDADATAIYGSRGANGVVLITTKRGAADKTKFDINLYKGVGSVARFMNLLDTKQWLEMRHEAFANDGVAPGSSQPDYDLLLWDTTRYTNWQKKLIGGVANITNAQVSFSGGSTSTQFLISGGYYKEGTVFPGDFSNQKGSIHFNVSHTASNRRFKISLTGTYMNEMNDLPREDLTSQTISLSPNAPALYDETGKINWENGTWENPMGSYLLQKYKFNSNNLIANSLISYYIIDGLQFKTNFGYTIVQAEDMQTVPISANYPGAGITTGSASFANNSLKTWIVEPQLEFQREIRGAKLNVLVGTTFQQNLQSSQNLSANGFTSDSMLENIKAASQIIINDVGYSKYRYTAFFGRVNVDWLNRYIINITGRRDGSSRFGPGNQFANFGALGAAWIFSNENFVKNSFPSFISFGKIRSSYGITGSDQIGDYQYLDTYKSTFYTYQLKSGLIPTRLVNPDYAWENNKKFEVALELGLLNDRISLTVGWYRNRSSNQLVGYTLPVITGNSSVQYNLPAVVQNVGLELELGSTNLKSDVFEWATYINLTVPRNKLISYPGLENSIYSNTYGVGLPITIQKKFRSTGVNSETGIYTFEDVNGNGTGTDYPEDLQFRKKIAQSYYGGFRNTVSYKRWRLDFMFQFVKQTGQSYLNSFLNAPGSFYGNQPDVVMKRWRIAGDVSDVQKFTQNYGSEADQAYTSARVNGDNLIADASFVRLKNISLSWQLPENLLSKVSMSNLRLYLQGQNIFTITNYIGMDPENQYSRSLPPLRVFTAGLQVTF